MEIIKKSDKLPRSSIQIKEEIIHSYLKIISSNKRKENIYHIILKDLKRPLRIKKNKEMYRIQKQLYFQTKSLFNQITKKEDEDFLFVMELPGSFSKGKEFFNKNETLEYHIHLISTSNKPLKEYEKLINNKISSNKTLSTFGKRWIDNITERDDINQLDKYFLKQNQWMDNNTFYYQYQK